MKIVGSGSASGSGSISQRHGSKDPDPDPHQNVMDPQHCLQHRYRTEDPEAFNPSDLNPDQQPWKGGGGVAGGEGSVLIP
jgi:hypothetical protein